MIGRLLIATLIVAISSGSFVAWQQWQRRRLTPLVNTVGRDDPWIAPTILYFRSDSCAPCTAQARFLTQLQAGLPVHVETIDVAADPQRAADYGVMTLPTTIVVGAQGNVKQINYGLTSATHLARQLEN